MGQPEADTSPTSGFSVYWAFFVVAFPVVAVIAGVKGYWGFTILFVVAAVFALLVLMAGRRYGKGSIRNIGRLLARR